MANGTLKVSNIQTSSGSGTITIGQSGETVSFPTGVNLSGNGITNTPAFEAYASSTQTLTNDAWVKVTFATETYDTDSAFASDKFTIPSGQAGKYYIYSSIRLNSTVTNDIADAYLGLYKNGTLLRYTQFSTLTVFDINVVTLSYATVLDAAVADYYEIYAYVDTNSGTPRAANDSNFGAYKLLGA